MDYSDRGLLLLLHERASPTKGGWLVPAEVMTLVRARIRRKRAPTTRKEKRLLSEDTVRMVRREYAEGATCMDLAGRVGLSDGAIHAIVTRRTYKDIA